MQSDEKYRDARIEVKVLEDSHHLGVPIDGRVIIWYPDEDASGRSVNGDWRRESRISIPFRDHRTNGDWFANPDAPKWRRSPIWEWKNPDEDPENITLHPSFGMQPNGEWELHCWIRDGEIELL